MMKRDGHSADLRVDDVGRSLWGAVRDLWRPDLADHAAIGERLQPSTSEDVRKLTRRGLAQFQIRLDARDHVLGNSPCNLGREGPREPGEVATRMNDDGDRPALFLVGDRPIGLRAYHGAQHGSRVVDEREDVLKRE